MDMRKILVCAAFSLAVRGGLMASPLCDADVGEFARLDGDTSDAARILRAVEKAGKGGIVWFPRGVYLIDWTLMVTNGASLWLHKSARLVATAGLDFVIDYSGGVMEAGGGRPMADHNLFIRGGEVDGKGRASCLRVRSFRRMEVSGLTLRNGRRFGLKLGAKELGRAGGGYEAVVRDVYCICDRPGMAGNVGMESELSDCHFVDCFVVDYTVGVRLRNSSCRLARCHVWGGMVRNAAGACEYLKDSVAFDLDNWDTLLDACYADTAKVGFRVRGHARVVNSAVFNNYEVFKMDDPLAIDHVDGNLTVANCHFVKTSPHARLYRGASKYPLRWRDNTLVRFTDEETRELDEKRMRDAQAARDARAAKGARP